MSKAYLKYLPYIFKKKPHLLSLTFFITHRCNFRCQHCFFLDKLNPENFNELSLDEIDKMASNMDDLLFLSVTGGEPFLRDDIVDIIRIFYKRNRLKNLVIPTNGFLKDRILSGVEEILKSCPTMGFNLGISIDDFEKEHDELRGVKGSFKKAVDTFRALKELKKSYPALSIEIVTTMTAKNQDHLESFYDFVFEDLKPDAVNLSIVRGDIKEVGMHEFDLDKYEKLVKRIQGAYTKGNLAGYRNFSLSNYAFSVRMIAPQILIRLIEEDRWQIPCLAGTFSGVLYANGDLYPCEMLQRRIGNIRDAGYDFKALWNSKVAKNIRRFVRESKCYCEHPCNFTINILFNWRYLPAVFYIGTKFYLQQR
ncbi:radical SAM protein, partial [bacterium]|nr:radical SAM protein [bacterium]